MQERSNEMIQISFTLTRVSEFEFSTENKTTLKLLKESFVVHCGSIQLKKLVSAVPSQRYHSDRFVSKRKLEEID